MKTKIICLFLVCVITFSNQKLIQIDMQSNITDSELQPMILNYNYICDNWTPSLLNPLLTIPDSIDIEGYNLSYIKQIELNNILYDKNIFTCDVSRILFNNQYNTYLGICTYYTFTEYEKCYYGLSPSVPEKTQGLDKQEYNLAILKNNRSIDNQIFSFEKWEINKRFVKTTFYLGDSHEHFQSDEGYIGTCTIPDNEYWSCSFNEMTFNDVVIPLLKDDKTLYTIYFTSDSYDIIFPNSFKTIFTDASDGKCTKHIYDVDYYLDCEGLNDKEFIPLRLSKEGMNITIEIDFYYNYSTIIDNPRKRTRIKFDGIDYIIFPLMMFKQFHVEFNAEKKMISFYTEDGSILEVPKVVKEKSYTLVICLLIGAVLVFILIIALLIYCIKKHCNENIEKKISKYNRFEDDDDFQHMNDTREY